MSYEAELDKATRKRAVFAQEVRETAEAVERSLERGSRASGPVGAQDRPDNGAGRSEYRVRKPTNSERMNRSLAELSLSAFKIHTLIWQWRGAPARGTLPFFTIHSLRRFCHLTRPTIRRALLELVSKGWIVRHKYNSHHKNALYALVPVRKIPRPADPPRKERGKHTNS